MDLKHQVKDIFVVSDGSTLLIIEGNEQLQQSLLGEWQIWKDDIVYKSINITAENIPVPRLGKIRVLETGILLNKDDLDTEKHLVELVFIPHFAY